MRPIGGECFVYRARSVGAAVNERSQGVRNRQSIHSLIVDSASEFPFSRAPLSQKLAYDHNRRS